MYSDPKLFILLLQLAVIPHLAFHLSGFVALPVQSVDSGAQGAINDCCTSLFETDLRSIWKFYFTCCSGYCYAVIQRGILRKYRHSKTDQTHEHYFDEYFVPNGHFCHQVATDGEEPTRSL